MSELAKRSSSEKAMRMDEETVSLTRETRGRVFTLALLSAVTVGVVLAGVEGHKNTAAAQAQNPERQDAATQTPPAQPPGPDAATETPDPSRLLREAEREGSVRAIVGLRTGFVPEGRLSGSRIAGQRDAIDDTRADLRADLSGTGYRTLRDYETVPYVALTLPPRALRALQRSPNATGITEDVAVPTTLAESTGIVQAPPMWNSGYTGAGQTIAVFDTGVDNDHPFLDGKVVEEACCSANSDCPNGETTQTGEGAGVPCTYAPEGCEHGTHVAGIAAGEGEDFSGTARDADIMAVQVFSEETGAACDEEGEDPCTLSSTSDQIAGLERVYAVRNTHDIAAVNMSLGVGEYAEACDAEFPALKAAIDNLRSEGIATVVSSGNSGYTDSMGLPACISSAISVGSTTDDDKVSSFSNSASFLSLLAPGTAIESSIPGGGFEGKDGTSMAAPHVAGAWALLKQKNPGRYVGSILSILQNTGTSVTDDRPEGTVTKHRINVTYAAFAGTTERVSVDSSGNQANRSSGGFTSMSPDGRYIVFDSYESLVADDTNDRSDVYVRDQRAETIERVSVDSSENEGNDNSYSSSITPDGRFISFTSRASDLVEGDANERPDIFVRDRQSGTTERVSPGDNYDQFSSISSDGRFVAFDSNSNMPLLGDNNNTYDIFVYDRQTDDTKRVSVDSSGVGGLRASFRPSISSDGRHIAFHSFSDLVADDTNNMSDVFLHDQLTGTTERLSVRIDGVQVEDHSQNASMSPDGRFVAFESQAHTLLDGTGTTIFDTNNEGDVFVRDLRAGSIRMVSLADSGLQANSYSEDPSISPDGRFVAFNSMANNLVAGDSNNTPDVYVRDLQARATERVSVNSDEVQAIGGASLVPPSISSDGRFVAFDAYAANLVEGDTNGTNDVFVRDRYGTPDPPVANDDSYTTNVG